MGKSTLRRRAVGGPNAKEESVSSAKDSSDPQPLSQSSEAPMDAHAHEDDSTDGTDASSVSPTGSDDEELGHDDLFMRFAPTGPELSDDDASDCSDSELPSVRGNATDYSKPKRVERFAGPIKVGLDGIEGAEDTALTGSHDKEIFLFGLASFMAACAVGFCIPIYTTIQAESTIAVGMIILIIIGLLIGFGVVKATSPGDKTPSKYHVNYVPTKILAGIIAACIGLMMGAMFGGVFYIIPSKIHKLEKVQGVIRKGSKRYIEEL